MPVVQKLLIEILAEMFCWLAQGRLIACLKKSNISHKSLDYLKFCLGPLTGDEQQMTSLDGDTDVGLSPQLARLTMVPARHL